MPTNKIMFWIPWKIWKTVIEADVLMNVIPNIYRRFTNQGDCPVWSSGQ